MLLQTRLAYAQGPNALDLAKSCVDQLDGLVDDASLGLVFVSGPPVEMSDEIVRTLKTCLGVGNWVGASATGIFANEHEFGNAGGLVVLCLALPEHAFCLCDRPVSGRTGEGCSDQAIIWFAGAGEHERCADLSFAEFGHIGAVCGGDGAALFLNSSVAAGAVGIGFRAGVDVIARMGRGTRELGPWRQITSSVGGEIFKLDGQKATDVVEADAGEILARQPDRLMRQILVETSACGSGMAASRLTAIDGFQKHTGRMLIRDRRPGPALRLVHRPPEGARDDLVAMARDLMAVAAPRQVVAALLLSSEWRGSFLFGADGRETELLHAELGNVPLVGLRTQDEFFEGKLATCSAILCLIVSDG